VKTCKKRPPVLGGKRGPRTRRYAPSVPDSIAADNSHGAIPVRDHYLLTELEVAELCGVSRWTVREWMKAGHLRPVALPAGIRRNLYRRGDVEAFAAGLREG